MNTHCDVCYSELIKGKNRVSNWSKRCVLIGFQELSPCQKAKNKETSKEAMKESFRREEERQAETDLYISQFSNVDIKKRICLRCDQSFESNGIHNRLCERCSNVNSAEFMTKERAINQEED